MRGLVELHGGSVSVHSDGEDRGARFTVSLPAIEQPVAPETAPRTAGAGNAVA